MLPSWERLQALWIKDRIWVWNDEKLERWSENTKCETQQRQVQSATMSKEKSNTQIQGVEQLFRQEYSSKESGSYSVYHKLNRSQQYGAFEKKANLMLGYIKRSVICKAWMLITLLYLVLLKPPGILCPVFSMMLRENGTTWKESREEEEGW